MARQKNILYTMQRAIDEQTHTRDVYSKREDERAHDGRAKYIHSPVTAQVYRQQVERYGHWLREHGDNYCTVEHARERASEYLHEMAHDHSAHTVHTARSAIARALDCTGRDICDDLQPRRAADITRGRTMTTKAYHAERSNPELAEVCRSTGLRHGKELSHLTAADLRYNDRGELYAVHTVGKGGRERDALIMGERGRELLERAAAERPDGPLFRVPDGMNVHGYRADYAARCYDYAVEHGITNGNMYRPNDGSGRDWDKAALDFVDENLGHGEGRYYTAVYNYLSYGDSSK